MGRMSSGSEQTRTGCRTTPPSIPRQNGTPKRVHTTSQAPIDETGLPSRAAATAQVAGQPRVAADGSAVAGIRSTIGAYIALTKPRIIELLLVTTLPTMILAQGGFPDFWLVVKTLVGGTLAAASANVFNCYIDRDIDELMNRTKRRPLVTGEISPRAALVFATALGVVALGAGGFWLWEAHGLQNRAKSEVTGGKLKEMRLFHWSITYVSILFVAVAVDPFLR